jgi:hypothetical protein
MNTCCLFVAYINIYCRIHKIKLWVFRQKVVTVFRKYQMFFFSGLFFHLFFVTLSWIHFLLKLLVGCVHINKPVVLLLAMSLCPNLYLIHISCLFTLKNIAFSGGETVQSSNSLKSVSPNFLPLQAQICWHVYLSAPIGHNTNIGMEVAKRRRTSCKE